MKATHLKIIGCTLLIAMLACRSGRQQSASERPNIIILFADDMGYSDLGCMGSEIRTPNLDQLAREGVLMTHFYTTSRCCPSRASLMTGQYAHRVGMGHMNYDWELPSYRGFLTNGAVTIPEVLQTAGYRTLMTGKWHIGDERPNWPIDRGFQRFYGIPAGGGVYFWPPVGLERPVYLDDRQIEPEAGWYSTDAFTTQAIEFIKVAKKEEKPFFLYTAYIAPHFPLQAWPEDIARYAGKYDAGYDAIRRARYEKQQKLGVLPPNLELSPADFGDWAAVEDPAFEARRMEVYAAMVDRLDQNVGRLMAALEAEGLAENTIVFFLSDNGGCPNGLNNTPEADLGSPTSFVAYGKAWANVSNTPYRLYKAMEQEGGLLTPLIARWPAGIRQPGRITHEPAHIIDFMATCLDLAGADYPQSVGDDPVLPPVGRSFLPQLRGEEADDKRPLFWEHEGNQAVRQGPWKLVKRHRKAWELYNLDEDPTELNDLSGQYPEKQRALLSAYEAWARDNGVRDWPVPH
ncbi:arylsulfatase [Flavilitoribacter nigricans]|uniref:Arylsulfatase n=1 Tax=Flavilitoribacter nigricans (strain ATCC 23147 / DSM 23189 / NBRC 102662 / NCIMB 1420 / SS-2) TaxID=1122177 RepID=A0A2D0NI58_FLAN2|nr:arylsulfatase [Flavilitoribacter nigricans]PHN08171.1 arylsulfatase [Flavilitoribacter nigricans DSM 23189 = NBRC 102662]